MSTPDKSDTTDSTVFTKREFDEPPAQAVVTTVAAVTDQSPLEMAPLFEAVCPDSLNKLFDNSRAQSSSVTVTFEYCERRVTVSATRIQVAPVSES